MFVINLEYYIFLLYFLACILVTIDQGPFAEIKSSTDLDKCIKDKRNFLIACRVSEIPMLTKSSI